MRNKYFNNENFIFSYLKYKSLKVKQLFKDYKNDKTF